MSRLLALTLLVACSADPVGPRFDSGTGRRDAATRDGGRFDGGDDGGRRDGGSADGGLSDARMDAAPACTPPGSCDPLQRVSPCPTDQSCRPDSDGNFRCAPIEADPFNLGENCTTAASCARGLLCLNFGDGFRCHGLCPADSVGRCPSGYACSGSLGTECVEVCRPAPVLCDIYRQDCPNSTDACVPTFEPETDEPITACRPAGTQGLGEPCGSAAMRCERGLVCVRSGGSQVCRELCTEETCAAGTSCVGTIAMWDITYCAPS